MHSISTALASSTANVASSVGVVVLVTLLYRLRFFRRDRLRPASTQELIKIGYSTMLPYISPSGSLMSSSRAPSGSVK